MLPTRRRSYGFEFWSPTGTRRPFRVRLNLDALDVLAMDVERPALGVSDPCGRGHNEEHDDGKPAFHDLTTMNTSQRKAPTELQQPWEWNWGRHGGPQAQLRTMRV
jgi:hypothetical protein